MRMLTLYTIFFLLVSGSMLCMGVPKPLTREPYDVIIAQSYVSGYDRVVNKGTRKLPRFAISTTHFTVAPKTAPFLALDWHPDGQQLAAGWQGPEGAIIYKKIDGQWIRSARYGCTPDISSGGLTGSPHATFNTPTKTIAWSPDGQQLAFGGSRSTYIKHPDSDEPIEMHLDTDVVAWSPKGKLLTIGGSSDDYFGPSQEVSFINPEDQRIKTPGFLRRIYNSYAGPPCISSLKFQKGENPISISWQPQGLQLAIGLKKGSIHIASLADSHAVPGTENLENSHVAWSPSGEFLAGGSEDGNIRIWNTRTWRLIKTLVGSGAINAIKWRPTLNQLSATHGDKLTIWDVDSASKIEDLVIESRSAGEDGAKMLGLAWTQNGIRLAASNNSGVIAIWDLSQEA